MPEDAFWLTDLVESARRGDIDGWRGLVAEFTPLVRSVIRRHSLRRHDAEDVFQTVWLRLLEHLDTVRQPQLLPGWISAVSRNECVNVRRRSRRVVFVDDWPFFLEALSSVGPEPVEELDAQDERRRALRAGLRDLSARHRRLLILLLRDPPPSYEEIGAELDMPVGSIGPTRARAVRRLRQSPALAPLFDSGPAPAPADAALP